MTATALAHTGLTVSDLDAVVGEPGAHVRCVCARDPDRHVAELFSPPQAPG